MKGFICRISMTSGFLSLMLGIATAQTASAEWLRFISRGGWRIDYPTSWKTFSCHSCRDMKAPNVYVTFVSPRLKASDGSVMISPLANKPANTSFARVEVSANQNAEAQRLRFELNGKPALKVRYINRSSPNAPVEIEEVYVVSGCKTYSIEFSGEQPGHIEDLANFPVYKKMVESFKIHRVSEC